MLGSILSSGTENECDARENGQTVLLHDPNRYSHIHVIPSNNKASFTSMMLEITLQKYAK